MKDNVSSSNEEVFSISESLFETLKTKGFSENAIKKSIVSGCIDESTCTQWIEMHAGHPELDNPLPDGVVVNIKIKRYLTEEERLAKVEELRQKAKEKKAQEMEKAKEEAHRKELERIKFGRDAIEAERRRKELLRETEAREKERQKKIDMEAKRRIKLQLRVDKLMRGGKSEDAARELAEAQLKEEEEAEAAAELARANAKKEAGRQATQQESKPLAALVFPAVSAAATIKQVYEDEPEMCLEEALTLCKRIGADLSDAAVNARKTLTTILFNIVKDPLNNKLRVLKTTTGTFTNKILPLPDALRLLRFCHFDAAEDAEGVKILINNTVLLRPMEKVLHALA